MCLDTAKRVVRRVFESPSPSILLELDGAEPLANWPVVKLLVEGARKAAVDGGRELRVRLVSDLSLLNLDKLDFLISNAVDFRVPLHGPEDLHDEARASVGGAAHAKTLRWLRAIREKAEGKASRVEATVSASRLSLGRHAEIVDAHARAGLGAVSVRRAGPFEVAPASRAAAVLSPDEYLDFYRGFLDSVLAANARAVFVEETARAFLTRILTDAEPGSERLRSPSGEGLGLLAYDVDGAIYACEEGAILGRAGDDSFRIGSVREGTASDAAAHPAVKALAVASLLENQPDCARCAYNPYHGVSPAQCYAEQGDIFGRMPTNARCRIDKGILDLLFERLQDAANEAVFRGWLTPQNVGGSFRKEVL
jgi:radical SAM protein with 4Fe4S-binding SPASM domain